MTSPENPCPCGSGRDYSHCCGPLHAHAMTAPTAEALTRSRYSAFALGLSQYLYDTWDSATSPPLAELTLDPDVEWLRLIIHDTTAGQLFDDQGIVEFTAIYSTPASTRKQKQHEKSLFTRDSQRNWVYTSALTD